MIGKNNISDIIYSIFCYTFATLVFAVTIYPMLYIFSASLSDPDAVIRGQVWLYPKNISFEAYKRVLGNMNLWQAYLNTIWYVVVGTAINIIMTSITAYPLSRKSFGPRRIIMFLIALTMFFYGGLVPTYMIVHKMGLVGSRWSLVIPVAILAYYLIIMRSFFEEIPESLHESARIDGSNDIGIFIRIVLPLSKPVLAVMVMFYAVNHWNSYFWAMIYLSDKKLYPLQILLREIIIQFDVSEMTTDLVEQNQSQLSQTIRYATIIVSTVPILLIYPFAQKYFVKGVMIGAVKG